MNFETKRALNQSIEKWDGLAKTKAKNVYEVPLGPQECPLCDMFWHLGCEGCPIAEKTGDSGCLGTPYYEAIVAENMTEFRKHARRELKFLESLRPNT